MAKLPEDIAEMIGASVEEAFLLFDEVVALAGSKAAGSAVNADLALQIVFKKLAERFMQDGWRPGELCEWIFAQVPELSKPNS